MERRKPGNEAAFPFGPWPDHFLRLGLLAVVFAHRAWHGDQPIVENYVGRQVPTAMVARNLERGSGFLRPQLDTGPFPNLFLVEPPVAAQLAAWLGSGTGIPLDRAGRLVSAFGTTLAAWGLYGLMVRRRGRLAAVGAVVAFAAFPVTIRYGRAFQPDAFALGCAVAGLNCWDGPGRLRAVIGALLLAAGLAQKVTWGLSLLLPCLVISRPWPRRLRMAAVACLLPALAWYAWVAYVLTFEARGSNASVDNAANWLARLASPGFADGRRLLAIGKDLVVRSFTPVGFCLALVIPFRRASVDRLWSAWMLGGGLTLLILFGKLHHDYYWLVLAPAVAGGVGIAITQLAGRSRWCGGMALGGLLVMGLVQSRSTWDVPDEWREAPALAASVARHVPAGALVIAPEAVIYLGDRPGCRLEWEAGSIRRAANEWRPAAPFSGTDPAELVAFYRNTARARFFADLDHAAESPARRRLHEALRHDPRIRVLEDRPGRYLLVEFAGPG